jgi:hypothetical protein
MKWQTLSDENYNDEIKTETNKTKGKCLINGKLRKLFLAVILKVGTVNEKELVPFSYLINTF